MPRAMECPQSVTIEGILYVYERGGRYRDILRYDLYKEQWCEPVKHQYWNCGMRHSRAAAFSWNGRTRGLILKAKS